MFTTYFLRVHRPLSLATVHKIEGETNKVQLMRENPKKESFKRKTNKKKKKNTTRLKKKVEENLDEDLIYVYIV